MLPTDALKSILDKTGYIMRITVSIRFTSLAHAKDHY